MSRLMTHAFLGLAVLLGSCGSTAPGQRVNTVRSDLSEALELSEAELEALDPELRSTLRRDAHHYFRYVAEQFVGLECEVSDEGPTVNLHGDAHLEQYMVTSLGRGLGDFDEATTGSVSIDFVRLATSVRIASRTRGWDARELWSRFLEGYIDALGDESFEAPEPAFARRTREAFSDDHAALLSWCDSLFTPLDDEVSATVEIALTSYVEMLQRQRPELDVREFEVVTIGPHRLGVGSRRASNFLIRTRGPTDDPSDDLIIEAKEVTRNPLATCLPISRRTDPLRILVADARIAYAPFRDVGYVEVAGRPYWIHEWVNDYVELEVSDPDLDQDAVAEVLYDVGVQLGHGHPRGLGDPYQAELRRELSRFVAARGLALWATSQRLADALWSAWRSLE